MGNQAQHHKKCEEIQSFIESIGENDHLEWIVIALFYKALHTVEKMLASKSDHTTSHEERNRRLKNKYPEILRAYKPLYNYSLVCRYRFQQASVLGVSECRKNLGQLEKYADLEIAET